MARSPRTMWCSGLNICQVLDANGFLYMRNIPRVFGRYVTAVECEMPVVYALFYRRLLADWFDYSCCCVDPFPTLEVRGFNSK